MAEKKGLARRVAGKVRREAVGLVKPKPYDPRHPEPAAREVPPAENVLAPGEPVWSPRVGGTLASSDVDGRIKVYADRTSVAVGGTIAFHVSVNPAQDFTVEIFRLGAETVSVLTGEAVAGTQQPYSRLAVETRTVRCDWEPSWRLEVPPDWASGVYVAKLRNAAGFQTCTPFVVRDDRVVPDILVGLPFPTYQAYNEYPKDEQTGASLYYAYENGQLYTEEKAATKVSFQRPYHYHGIPANFDLDAAFAKWVEIWAAENGKIVGYADSADLHSGVVDPAGVKALIFPGHDEYWSVEMRDALDKAIANGVNVAFLAANNVFWRIRFEDEGRTVVCYKNRPDPGARAKGEATTQWRSIGLPEQAVLGAQYVSTIKGTAPLVVDNAGHWFWEGTGVRNGERIPELLWGECDQVMTWTTSPDGVEILAASPFVGQGLERVQHTVVRRTAHGGIVFDGGTFHWAKGLAGDGVADWRIQRATANLLRAMTE